MGRPRRKEEGHRHQRPGTPAGTGTLVSVPFSPLLPTAQNYLIAYAPDKKPLWVVAIMHGRRRPRLMAAILRGRE
jgi:hypothetical protein